MEMAGVGVTGLLSDAGGQGRAKRFPPGKATNIERTRWVAIAGRECQNRQRFHPSSSMAATRMSHFHSGEKCHGAHRNRRDPDRHDGDRRGTFRPLQPISPQPKASHDPVARGGYEFRRQQGEAGAKDVNSRHQQKHPAHRHQACQGRQDQLGLEEVVAGDDRHGGLRDPIDQNRKREDAEKQGIKGIFPRVHIRKTGPTKACTRTTAGAIAATTTIQTAAKAASNCAPGPAGSNSASVPASADSRWSRAPASATFAPVLIVANAARPAEPANGASSRREPWLRAVSNSIFSVSSCESRRLLQPDVANPVPRGAAAPAQRYGRIPHESGYS